MRLTRDDIQDIIIRQKENHYASVTLEEVKEYKKDYASKINIYNRNYFLHLLDMEVSRAVFSGLDKATKALPNDIFPSEIVASLENRGFEVHISNNIITIQGW